MCIVFRYYSHDQVKSPKIIVGTGLYRLRVHRQLLLLICIPIIIIPSLSSNFGLLEYEINAREALSSSAKTEDG